jgi:hypothetical protein
LGFSRIFFSTFTALAAFAAAPAAAAAPDAALAPTPPMGWDSWEIGRAAWILLKLPKKGADPGFLSYIGNHIQRGAGPKGQV